MNVIIDNFREEYKDLVNCVLNRGHHVAPRGQATREVLNAVLKINDPTDVILTGTGRGLNTALMAVECLQVLGGVCATDLLRKATPNIAQFSEGGHFSGAYGPRVRAQLPKVVERLRQNPDTRQAVMTVWDPAQDLYYEGGVDYPCTVMLQFLIRDDKLLLHTTMRSNDIWWGTAYDVPMFCYLLINVADSLDVEVGAYYHHAVSLHVYDRDLEAISKLIDAPKQSKVKLNALPGREIEVKQKHARGLLFSDGTRGLAKDWNRCTDLFIEQLGRIS